MGDITIRLEFDRQTGKKNILVEYDSEPGAMAHEHEARHRQIVEQLVGKGLLTPDEAGRVIVTREGAAAGPDDPSAEPGQPDRERQKG